MLGLGLNARLRRISKKPSSETQDDLSGYHTGITRLSTSVPDHQTHSYRPDTDSEEDEPFESTDFVDDQSEQRSGDRAGERVEGLDALRRFDGFADGYLKDCVEVVGLHSPGWRSDDGCGR